MEDWEVQLYINAIEQQRNEALAQVVHLKVALTKLTSNPVSSVVESQDVSSPTTCEGDPDSGS